MLGKQPSIADFNSHSTRITGYLYFINDLRDVDTNTIYQKIGLNTHFSVSYILLLFASTIVCTLGLLLNAQAVVIGGMIISPLMWPLMKIAVGVSGARRSLVHQALVLLLFSLVFSLASAYLITIISPLKVVNDEILQRTTPTLLDIIIALAAGGIAALGIMQTKVSDSIAGVAIATSLMPPLCVAGIGIALANQEIFAGGFLLFLTNVVSIIFVSTLLFTFSGVRSAGSSAFKRQSFVLITLVLLVTAIPLFLFLKNTTFKSQAYQQIHTVLNREFTEISPSSYVQNIKTNVQSSLPGQRSTVIIDADVLIPEDVSIDYQVQKRIISELENALQANVQLQLKIQKTISLVSEQEQKNGQLKRSITEYVQQLISQTYPTVTIDSLNASYDEEKQVWNVTAVLRADPSIVLTDRVRQSLEAKLISHTKQPITLSMEIISRVRLKSEPELEYDAIRKTITAYLQESISGVDVRQVTITEPGSTTAQAGETSGSVQNNLLATINLQVPASTDIPADVFANMKAFVAQTHDVNLSLNVSTVEKRVDIIE